MGNSLTTYHIINRYIRAMSQFVYMVAPNSVNANSKTYNYTLRGEREGALFLSIKRGFVIKSWPQIEKIHLNNINLNLTNLANTLMVSHAPNQSFSNQHSLVLAASSPLLIFLQLGPIEDLL